VHAVQPVWTNAEAHGTGGLIYRALFHRPGVVCCVVEDDGGRRSFVVMVRYNQIP